ncbi:hypothetical protein [Pseudoduganella sp. OTU4001]|uniref:hypothetical protein n=1 Tax=Pseudoduganella sp. OTU4001 TaxID=3043854 RepID=UPI00313B8DA7
MSTHWREWLVGLGLFGLAWLVAGSFAYWAVASGRGHWLELFNGATWPPQFLETNALASQQLNRSFMFFLVLGLRTVLNLGVLFTAILAISAFYLVSSGQLKEWIMSKLNSVLATRDIAMAAYLEHALDQCKVELSKEQREELYRAAEAFHATEAGKAFQKSSKDAVAQVQQQSA